MPLLRVLVNAVTQNLSNPAVHFTLGVYFRGVQQQSVIGRYTFSDWYTFRASVSLSAVMLAPLMVMDTFLPLSLSTCLTAPARAVAPAGSANVCAFSTSSPIARRISSSLTSRKSSSKSDMMR